MKVSNSYQKKQNRLGYLFMAPWIIGFSLFTAFPFIFTIYLSFTSVKQSVLGWEIDFIGTANYITAFFKNIEFLPALMSFLTMILTYAPIIIVISFILAYLLNSITKFRGILRTIYFLPVIVLSGPVMYQLMDADKTTTKQVYDVFVLRMIESYSPVFADILVTMFDNLPIILWFTGIPIVLFINGLQKINPSLYEAAQIDSANGWQILWKITIPMVKPIALVVSIFTIAQLGTFSTNPVFDLIKKATENTSGGLGIAATYSWIYSFIVLCIIGITFLLFHESKNVKRRGL